MQSRCCQARPLQPGTRVCFTKGLGPKFLNPIDNLSGAQCWPRRPQPEKLDILYGAELAVAKSSHYVEKDAASFHVLEKSI